MKRKIILHGSFSDHLPGGEFECVFNTAREAASAIEINFPGFFDLISTQYISVIPGGESETMSPEQLTSWQINSDELHISPVMIGAGGGGGGSDNNRGIKAILGFALIAVAIIGTGGLAGIAGGSLGGAVQIGGVTAFGITGMQVLGIGASLVMGAMAPAPGAADRQERVNNVIYTGPLNTNKEGSVLPYVAGERVIVGGVIINTELVVENTQ
jgi:predicted phage tail protein